MSTEPKKAQTALQLVEDQLKKAPSLRNALQLPFVQQRYIANYEAITGRKDGENKFADDLFILNEMALENQRIAECDRMSVAYALMKVGSTGLSLRAQGHLYMIPIGKNLKCQIGAHGKKEMLRQMKNVKHVHEAVVVVQGDIFRVDKLNNKIIQHESTDKSLKQITKLEDVVASYVRIEFKDRIVDVVVPYEDLLKAKNASKNKGEGNVWVTWSSEMAKKVAYNRAFKVYYQYPENVVILPGMEKDSDDEETHDVKHKDSSSDFMPSQQEEEEKKEEPVKEHIEEAQVVEQEAKASKKKDSFMD